MEVWENRCYSEGIPDYIEQKLMNSMRVPSYKAIAMCILKNDVLLLSCGFGRSSSKYEKLLMTKYKDENSKQQDMFK